MYVVRVNFRNGQVVNFLYKDMGLAKACAEDCAKAKMDGTYDPPKPTHLTQAHVFDEAGGEYWIDGSQVQAVQFADIEVEVMMNTRMRIMTARKERELLAMAGEGPAISETNGRAPMSDEPVMERRPVIGGGFAA